MSIWRTSFWCPAAEREVEVEFVMRGIPGLRRPHGVRSCSVFVPPTAVECNRRCLDEGFRSRWPSALPVQSRPDVTA